MRKWILRALYVAPFLIGGYALADYTATQGTVAAFVCQTTKICPGVAIYDITGTNGAGVKAASTAAVATDPAVVVAVSPNNTVSVAPQATATGAALNYHHYSVATSGGDTQNVKTSAATLYSVTITQSTTTALELKIYNTASAPTCSSGTGVVDNIPIPSNATSPGYHLTYPVGRAFGTGFSYCIVAFGAPAADTDAGTPVTGVTVSFTYD
jgi:hypothetical protein